MKFKKYFIILLMFILFIFKLDNVSAKPFQCVYGPNSQYEAFTLEIDVEAKKISMPDGTKIGSNFTGYDTYILDNIQSKWFDQDKKNTCMQVYVYKIVTSTTNYGQDVDVYLFMNEDEAKKKFGEEYKIEQGQTYTKIDTSCDKFNESYDKIEQLYSEYKECKKEGCLVKKLTEINQEKETIKTYCREIVKGANYNTECMQDCLRISETIASLDADADIETPGTGKCGASQRLISWLYNILKWVKYIVPVIVIVFGILDFIKAMGADKEDEMKKAQGKFVKRLIAAALIFIIPLILGFVLDKMGFTEYVDGCGIVEELDDYNE